MSTSVRFSGIKEFFGILEIDLDDSKFDMILLIRTALLQSF